MGRLVVEHIVRPDSVGTTAFQVVLSGWEPGGSARVEVGIGKSASGKETGWEN